VENIDQVKFLIAAGCHHGQGYYFSRPLSAERMTDVLTKCAERPRRPPRLELAAG